MDTFFKVIGMMIVSAIIVAVPLLCGLSFALGWDSFIRWVLMLGTLGVFGFMMQCLCQY